MDLTELSPEERLVILAKAAEFAKRYDEMAGYMKERVELGGSLTASERDLLSSAFKSSVDERRHSMRVVMTIAAQMADAGKNEESSIAESYISKVESELLDICSSFGRLLSTRLISNAADGEPKVFYHKLKADYSRYTLEFAKGSAKSDAIAACMEDYEAARSQASNYLLHSHPLKLQLALNYSVFQHEVLEEHEDAIETARNAYEAAMWEIPKMPEQTQREAAHSLELLQENLNLWKVEAASRLAREPSSRGGSEAESLPESL